METTPTQQYRDPRELKPHPDNPRSQIDETSDEFISLLEGISKHGVLQPLVISTNDLIFIGHRRQRAAIKAGLDKVPIVYRDLKGDEFAEEIFLEENMKRQALSPLEEAKAIASFKKKFEKKTKKTLGRSDLARRLNLPPYTISERLAILDLPQSVHSYFDKSEIPIRSSVMLSRLKEWPEEVEKIAAMLVTHKVKVKELDGVITTRIRALDTQRANEAQLAREPRLQRIRESDGASSHTPLLTREVVMDNLAAKGQGCVSMFDLKVVLDATCCSCGMIDNHSVCLNCPLPRFVNGLIGRANEN